MSNRILIGQIVNVHGIKGAVKIKPYLNDKMTIVKLNPLTDKSGKRSFELFAARVHGDVVIASIKGVTDRNAAETLRNVWLYADRSQLPTANHDEYYYCDLIGLTVLKNTEVFGTVTAVNNYGAGDILEITLTDGKVMDFAFTEEIFPQMDLQNQTIEFIPPYDVNGDVDED